ncbi:DUF4365 domain-containing protein [Streptomyces sp. NBC_01619]|uniref:DUF4365 domain-containing protein n=1 Tax=Streptomyces sp. NBC_01619 TaxID=2975901 RepID=UPI002254E843|nr:DUF4365 domain-containing protein [Streptomyces sp. NBC_01619]MCX4513277.1 DUF4365 domain-containing protein [Streptomyces sp. NBC_01619]
MMTPTLAEGEVIMRVQRSHGTERAGVSWVEHVVHTELGWLFRPQDVSDFGIDAHIEVVDSDSVATGRLLGLQIKSGSSYFGAPTESGWWFPCKAHAPYWLGHSLPVLVMLYTPEEKRVYWQHVNRHTVVSTGEGSKIHVPRCQNLTAESVHVLRPLARSASEVPEIDEWLAAKLPTPKQSAFYRHLVSARLCAMYPRAVVEPNELDTLWDLALYLEDEADWRDVTAVKLALVTSPMHAERLAESHPARFHGYRVPLVIVLMYQEQAAEPQNPADVFEKPSVFVAPWRPDRRDDGRLASAIDQALKWARAR